jgi:nucleoside-diphosphate-sugar epimerase
MTARDLQFRRSGIARRAHHDLWRRQQTRSFCYVDDLIDGLIGLMNSPDEVTGPMNLGNPVEIPVRELAEEIIASSGSRSTLSFHPLPRMTRCAAAGHLTGHPDSRLATQGHARRGLRRTIE